MKIWTITTSQADDGTRTEIHTSHAEARAHYARIVAGSWQVWFGDDELMPDDTAAAWCILWNWEQDCFTEGQGCVIGWLPFHAPPAVSPDVAALVGAAKEMVARWDTPFWKDAPATAQYINRLRVALSRLGGAA